MEKKNKPNSMHHEDINTLLRLCLIPDAEWTAADEVVMIAIKNRHMEDIISDKA